jgi:hypothetical protein
MSIICKRCGSFLFVKAVKMNQKQRYIASPAVIILPAVTVAKNIAMSSVFLR